MRHDEDLSRGDGSCPRVMSVDDRAGRRIETAPETEWLWQDETLSARLAFAVGRTSHLDHRHADSSRVITPLTADSTQSAVDPNITWIPMLPGA